MPERRKIQNVVIIGAGNLATQLALALHRRGVNVIEVLNRSRQSGERLARRVKAGFNDDFRAADFRADLFILAVSDSAIEEVARNLHLKDQFLVHTSGSVDLAALSGASSNTGVLYPLQTFSKEKRINFSNIPVCIEANTKENEEKLMQFASLISKKTQVLSSAQRKILHMTAVFAGNFSSFMYTIAEDLLKKHDIPFSLLKPLIQQTAASARHEDVFSRQTGPAVRGDTRIMDEHLVMLAKHGAYMDIYNLISKSIIKHKTRNDEL
ncbi:MAG: DUF2520 domain-containing protein [Bacteroidetes bacterium]|nr:DUF2520 domain-containing protein [Bacteroidota bacterium]